MGRPKRIRKPSKKALLRRARKAFRKTAGFVFLNSSEDWFAGSSAAAAVGDYQGVISGGWGGGAGTGGSGGAVSIAYTSNADTTNAGGLTITSGTSAMRSPSYDDRQPSRLAIESLDQGATWHTVDGMQPCARINDELVIGAQRSGPAPDCMRIGSGTYRFEVMVRRATDDEVRAWSENREREERDYARLAAERSARLEAATARARSLLLSHMTASQRRDFEARAGFWVRSQFGNMYWVTLTTAVRVDSRGSAIQRYCIHAVDPEIPREDNALARMLLLKCDEERFLRVANPGWPSQWDVGHPQGVVDLGGGITIAQNPAVRHTPIVTIPQGESVAWRPRFVFGPSTAVVPWREQQTALVALPESEWMTPAAPATAEAPAEIRVVEYEADGTPVGGWRDLPNMNLVVAGNGDFYHATDDADFAYAGGAMPGWRVMNYISIQPYLIWINGHVRQICG